MGKNKKIKNRVIVRTIDLEKYYIKKNVITEALRGINVEIYTGEFISVVGPSGSGKSTFFHMVGGLDNPSSGRVLIDEVDAAQLTSTELAFLRSKKIGYIFQSFSLVHYMTALENVMVSMSFAGVRSDIANKRAMSLLELVGLRDVWNHRPIEMSGGQQQRVAIARSMANNPSILLADEPTANLDLETGEEILKILKKLNEEKGVTIICATHDYRMLNVCDRIMWMRDGRVNRIAKREDVNVELNEIIPK